MVFYTAATIYFTIIIVYTSSEICISIQLRIDTSWDFHVDECCTCGKVSTRKVKARYKVSQAKCEHSTTLVFVIVCHLCIDNNKYLCAEASQSRILVGQQESDRQIIIGQQVDDIRNHIM